jgi:hypothetical protein
MKHSVWCNKYNVFRCLQSHTAHSFPIIYYLVISFDPEYGSSFFTIVSQCLLGPTQRPLPDNTQHSQETDIHALGGIRTHNFNKRVVIEPCLRNMGHCQAYLQEHECIRILNIMLDGDLLFTFKNLNLKREISKLMILGFCTHSLYNGLAMTDIRGRN